MVKHVDKPRVLVEVEKSLDSYFTGMRRALDGLGVPQRLMEQEIVRFNEIAAKTHNEIVDAIMVPNDEHPSDKPCRFLMESVRDSAVAGVPAGTRQRCAHQPITQMTVRTLVSTYYEILNVSEAFCAALVKNNPEVLDSLAPDQQIVLGSAVPLLITPKENMKDLIVDYLRKLDAIRVRIDVLEKSLRDNHAFTPAADKFFTRKPPPTACTICGKTRCAHLQNVLRYTELDARSIIDAIVDEKQE